MTTDNLSQTERALFSRAARRIIPVMILLYTISFLDRVNVGFAALTMNADLGFTPEIFGWGVGIFVRLLEGFVFGFDNYPVMFAVLIPLGALLGDLTGAFIKRRLSIAPGGLLPVVDQIDFVVGAVVFALPLALINWVGLTWPVIVTVLLLTPPIHLLTNYGAYKLKLKKHPW